MASPTFVPTQGRFKDEEPLLKERLRLMENRLEDMQTLLDRAYRKIARLEGEEPQLSMDSLIEDIEKLEALRLEREREQLEEDRERAKREADQEKKRLKAQKRGHGPHPQDALPIVEKIYELDEEPLCEKCGRCAPRMGEQYEESIEIHLVERRYVKRKVLRAKFRCTCQANIITAPAPPRVIPGGRYSLEFIIQCVIDKWLDHIPLERQTRIMSREGLIVGSQTLYDQAEALASRLEPIYERLGEQVLLDRVMHADETRWPLLDSKKNTAWMVWARTTPKIAHYAILPSKSQKAAEHLFEGYEGTIVVDGYRVYENLARDGPNLKLANCWAHYAEYSVM